MGRGHLIGLAALVAALLCVPAIAVAGTQPPTLILQGRTEPTAAQTPQAYFASKRSETAPWLRRLTTAHQARVRSVDFRATVLFAGFLNGRFCALDVKLQSWTHTASRLIVDVAYRKPPIGVATCVRTSVSYIVLGFRRATFGPLPSIVELRAHARS